MFERYDDRTKDALAGAGVTLVASGACLWILLSEALGADPAASRMAFSGIGVCVALVLHFVFAGIVAKRLRRSVVGWLLLLFFTFPLGSIAAGLLLVWFGDAPAAGEPPRSTPAGH